MPPGTAKRIFVVGTPRSGTTLVQALLASHSAVTSFTESHFFSRHFRHIPLLSTAVLMKDPGPRLLEFLVENQVDLPSRRAILTDEDMRLSPTRLLMPLRTRVVARQLLEILDRLALMRGCSTWVEKTAQHLHYLSFIETLHEPGRPAHFVHVIRDGADVVSSLHVASQHWERRPYAFARGPAPPYDIETCISRWNNDLAISLSRVDAPTDHFIFYDDLTADPEGMLTQLCSSIGLRCEARMLEDFGRTAHGLIAPFETWKEVAPTVRRPSTAGQTLTRTQRDQVRRSLHHDLYTQLRRRAQDRLVG